MERAEKNVCKFMNKAMKEHRNPHESHFVSFAAYCQTVDDYRNKSSCSDTPRCMEYRHTEKPELESSENPEINNVERSSEDEFIISSADGIPLVISELKSGNSSPVDASSNAGPIVHVPRNAANQTGNLWHMEGDGIDPFPDSTEEEEAEEDEEADEDEEENESMEEDDEEDRKPNQEEARKEDYVECMVEEEEDKREVATMENYRCSHETAPANLASEGPDSRTKTSLENKDKQMNDPGFVILRSKNNSSKQEFERGFPKKVYQDEKSPRYMYPTTHPNLLKKRRETENNNRSDSYNEKIVNVDCVNSFNPSVCDSEESEEYVYTYDTSDEISPEFYTDVASEESETTYTNVATGYSHATLTHSYAQTSPYLSSYMSFYSNKSTSSRFTLPKLNTSGPVQLICNSGGTYNIPSERATREGYSTRSLIEKANKVAIRLRQQQPDILKIDTPPTEQACPSDIPPSECDNWGVRVNKPRVPLTLRAQALMRDGQLEVTVIDDRNRLPKDVNLNVKITVVHKPLKKNKPIIPTPAKRKDSKFPGNKQVDRDILKHRAMHPPFNTFTDEEASKRHIQHFGLK